jgi:hypothetical protein
MSTLLVELQSRVEEFEAHLALAIALERRMFLEGSIESVRLSVRHVNALKSGLIVHLYNIIESTMSRVMREFASALVAADPRNWTEESLREWLRGNALVDDNHATEEGRLSRILSISKSLISLSVDEFQGLKKPSGTWDDKVISSFLRRVNMEFNPPEEVQRQIAPSARYGDNSPLRYLSDRRNAIAHGRLSFENGASELELAVIRDLAEACLNYIRSVAVACGDHITSQKHLVIVR